MKKFLPLLLFVLTVPVAAQTAVRPEVDLHFHWAMVNNEFDASSQALAPSLTLAAVRFSPYIGLRFGEHHRLKGGISVIRDFGTPGEPLQTELAVWYQLDRKGLRAAAGIFPRALLQGPYSTAILSDKQRYYDALLEGCLLQWNQDRFGCELALDWNGKKGAERREQFNFITAGQARLNEWLSLQWEGMLHHYACSFKVQGVVDDILLHPYVGMDWGPRSGWERLAIEAGVMAGYHCDRIRGEQHTPIGADIVTELRKWGAGLRNEAYYGGSQAPFYGKADQAGLPYADQLYMRNSLWQITPDGHPGFYDRCDLYWMPPAGKHVKLRLCFTAHFGHGGFLGHQEILEAVVQLDRLCFKKKKTIS